MNQNNTQTSTPPVKVDCLEVLYAGRMKVSNLRATDSQMPDVALALQNYGYLLHSDGAPKPASYSVSQLADRIERVYDQSEPRNAAVVKTLRAVHTQQVRAVFQQQAGLAIT